MSENLIRFSFLCFFFQLLFAISFLPPQLEYNFLKEGNKTNLFFFLSLVAPSCLVHI